MSAHILRIMVNELHLIVTKCSYLFFLQIFRKRMYFFDLAVSYCLFKARFLTNHKINLEFAKFLNINTPIKAVLNNFDDLYSQF